MGAVWGCNWEWRGGGGGGEGEGGREELKEVGKGATV